MINGTVRIVDCVISFYVTYGGDTCEDTVTYTVTEQVENNMRSETVHSVSARDFMVALGIALDYDGGESLSAKQYARAESVIREIRWIP